LVKGAKFAKLLGSGGDGGFSFLPNFSVYAILIAWENEELADEFFKTNTIYLNYLQRSFFQKSYHLNTLSAHGFWDGKQPFEHKKLKTDGQIAVLTRAKIRLSKIFQFWQNVKPTSQLLKNSDGLLFSVGIGELPWVQQATFSVWENTDFMIKYAYQNEHHTKVIKKTRELGWYSEELFARFELQKNNE
jgi:hypothetical protein